MFEYEARTSIHAIPVQQQIIYYGILAALYLLFLRVKGWDAITVVILLIFTQGFFLAFGRTGFMVFKGVMSVAVMLSLWTGTRLRISLNGLISIFLFFLFSLMYFLGSHYSGSSYAVMINQYYKYLIPFGVFLAITKSRRFQENPDHYIRFIVKLIQFQIVFTIVKIIVIGFRENIIGSVATTGGAVSVTYALMGALLFWRLRGEKLIGNDWLVLFSFLIIPIGSNKRAIWLIFPMLLGLLMVKNVTKRSLKNISTILLLIPILVYFGFRFNPSFNPERVFWGSFDPEFAINWMINYSTGANRTNATLGYGRIGTAEVIVGNITQDPWSNTSLLGHGGSNIDEEDIDPRSLGIAGGTVAGFAQDLIVYGWPTTVVFFLWSLSLIWAIRDRHNRLTILILLLWNYFFYTGGFLRSPANAFIFFITLAYLKQKSMQAVAFKLPQQIHDPQQLQFASKPRVIEATNAIS